MTPNYPIGLGDSPGCERICVLYAIDLLTTRMRSKDKNGCVFYLGPSPLNALDSNQGKRFVIVILPKCDKNISRMKL